MKIKNTIIASSIAFCSIAGPISALTSTPASAATKKAKLTTEQKAIDKELKKAKSSAKNGKIVDAKAKIGQTYSKFTKANKKTKDFTLKRSNNNFTYYTIGTGSDEKGVQLVGPEKKGVVTYLRSKDFKSTVTYEDMKRTLGEPASKYKSSYGYNVVRYNAGKYKMEFYGPSGDISNSTKFSVYTVSALNTTSYYSNNN